MPGAAGRTPRLVARAGTAMVGRGRDRGPGHRRSGAVVAAAPCDGVRAVGRAGAGRAGRRGAVGGGVPVRCVAVPAVSAMIPGLDIGACYRQAGTTRQVGGDWYDALALPGGRAYLAVSDVVGHGLTAAEDMTQLRNAGRALAIADHRPPRSWAIWLASPAWRPAASTPQWPPRSSNPRSRCSPTPPPTTRCFRESLVPGGRLFVDVPVHRPAAGHEPMRCWRRGPYLRTRQTMRTEYDPAADQTTRLLRYDKWQDGTLCMTELQVLRLQYWNVHDFEDLLAEAGFIDVLVTAGYKNTCIPGPATASAPSMPPLHRQDESASGTRWLSQPDARDPRGATQEFLDQPGAHSEPARRTADLRAPHSPIGEAESATELGTYARGLSLVAVTVREDTCRTGAGSSGVARGARVYEKYMKGSLGVDGGYMGACYAGCA